MKLSEEKYNKYALVREMMETPSIIKSFKPEAAARFAASVGKHKGLFLTGEGFFLPKEQYMHLTKSD